MKRLLYIGVILVFAACQKDRQVSGGRPKPEVKIDFYKISANTTWSKDTIYVLSYGLEVTDNAVLTIEPGTVIKADYQNATLSVQRGAKLIAEGTAEHPIVFTSGDTIGQRHHGSWNGIFIYGKAPLTAFDENTYQDGYEMDVPGNHGSYGQHVSNWGGGDDPADNSGILKYIRVEFASRDGAAALNFTGVGTGTVVEHIEVSYSSGAAFAFWGGTVNARNLVAFNNLYGGFLYTNGYAGRQQFLLSYAHPWFASSYPAYPYPPSLDGLIVLNDVKDYPVGYDARPVISNLTVAGPYNDPGVDKYKPWNAAVNVTKGAAIALRNSVLMGMPAGFKFGENAAAQHLGEGAIDLSYNLVHSNVAGNAFTVDQNFVYSIDAATVAQYAADHHNTVYAKPDDLLLSDPFNYKQPGMLPKAGSPLLGGANFEGGDFDVFFQPVAYVGAFGSDDWMKGWTDFYPITTKY